jgi:hypothetical protein
MNRRNGRPPLDPADPSVQVCVKVPAKHYDALYRTASAGRVSVPELFRRAIHRNQKYLKQTRRDP